MFLPSTRPLGKRWARRALTVYNDFIRDDRTNGLVGSRQACWDGSPRTDRQRSITIVKVRPKVSFRTIMLNKRQRGDATRTEPFCETTRQRTVRIRLNVLGAIFRRGVVVDQVRSTRRSIGCADWRECDTNSFTLLYRDQFSRNGFQSCVF